jgi:hypothetical protein
MVADDLQDCSAFIFRMKGSVYLHIPAALSLVRNAKVPIGYAAGCVPGLTWMVWRKENFLRLLGFKSLYPSCLA